MLHTTRRRYSRAHAHTRARARALFDVPPTCRRCAESLQAAPEPPPPACPPPGMGWGGVGGASPHDTARCSTAAMSSAEGREEGGGVATRGGWRRASRPRRTPPQSDPASPAPHIPMPPSPRRPTLLPCRSLARPSAHPPIRPHAQRSSREPRGRRRELWAARSRRSPGPSELVRGSKQTRRSPGRVHPRQLQRGGAPRQRARSRGADTAPGGARPARTRQPPTCAPCHESGPAIIPTPPRLSFLRTLSRAGHGPLRRTATGPQEP